MSHKILLLLILVHLSAADNELKPIQVHISPSKSRIIGGEEVVPHSVPFQVGLRINNNGFFCGGVLIASQYVLTAAHCGQVITTVDVVLGAHNISDLAEESRVVIRGLRTIIHEAFDDFSLRNDIALIQLESPAPLGDNIGLAVLPPRSDVNQSYWSQVVTATGWGLPRDVLFPIIDDLSDVLLGVDLVVSNLTECQLFYNDVDIEHVVDSNVCTSGYRNRGTCNGDSGGPLTLGGVLIGLSSFGTFLCEACSPSVYTKVANYVDWIVENIDITI